MKKIIVIGAGFAGIAAATCLADAGYEVTVLEKNDGPGGRARMFKAEGFTFDMGPSWYWMPDVFESYFQRFGKKPSDYYNLVRLDPSYAVIFPQGEVVNLPAGTENVARLFEAMEPGSTARFHAFLEQAAYKYKVGMHKFVWKPSRSIREFMSLKLLADVTRLDVLQSFHSHIRKFFSHDKILKLMEFPILFLGAIPQNTPAMYSLMNYAEISMGTWYPMGGMHEIVKAMVKLAEEKGVQFRFGENVIRMEINAYHARKVVTQNTAYEADIVVAGADYHHIDADVLGDEHRNYGEKYWKSRVIAPSSLLFYLGVSQRVNRLLHHNLFFDEDFTLHAHEIYTEPQWPSKPLFYVSAPSKTDASVAPEGCENLFILIPVAPDLEDTEEIREKYYHMVMERLERFTGQNIRESVVYKRGYAHRDFKADYNAYRGNAYGLANTLMQTAFLKPTLKSKKVRNLFYTGQLTVPGPGVPPSLISGQVVAAEVMKEFGGSKQ